jgi:Phage integrase, N-terminal SAM-like domain
MDQIPVEEPKPKKLLDQVRDALRVKHYSYRTEESYVQWIRSYILFHIDAPNRIDGWGFLDLRRTFKSTILAAMLKPFNRAIAPIDESNLVNPRGFISPSALGYKPSVRARPALRFRNYKGLFFWWWDVIF